MDELSGDFSGGPIIPVCVSMMVLSTVAVVLRFVSRRITRVHLWWDDWLILAALPLTWFECLVDLAGQRVAGFGTHIYTFSSYDEVKLFLGFVYGFQIAYCIAVTLPKFSMIAMYWRVFGMENFRWPLITTAAMTGMYLIAVVLVATFSCIPIAGFWDRTIPANCLPLLNFYIGQAVATIIIDITLLLIPIIPIRRLNITRSQKIAVGCIFGLGIFVTISSAIRLKALVDTTTNPTAAVDPSYYFVPASIWSIVETCLSVVCACLPSMRPLLRYMLHGRFRSSGGASSGAGRSGYGSAVESANRNSTFGISSLAARAGVRSKSTGGPSALERANQWERANSKRDSKLGSKRDSKRPPLPPKLASFPLTKLGTSVSVSGGHATTDDIHQHHSRLASFGRRDNWRELSGGELAPWDETVTPRSRVRTMYEVEERVKRVLSPTGNRKDKDGEENDDEKAVEAGEAVDPRQRSGSEVSGPLRLDEYEIRSEPADSQDAGEDAFGYRYEIRGGFDDDELEGHSSSQSSSDKVWEVSRKRS